MQIFKRSEQYLLSIFKLGKTERIAKQALRSAQDLQGRVQHLQANLGQFEQDIKQQSGDLASHANRNHRYQAKLENDLSDLRGEIDHRLFNGRTDVQDTMRDARIKMEAHQAELRRVYTDMTLRLDRMATGLQSDAVAPKSSHKMDGLKDLRAAFQRNLNLSQDPTPEIEIGRMLLPDVEAALTRCEGKQLTALGGETALITYLKEVGLDVMDAGGRHLITLSEMPDQSCACLIVDHLVEHQDFDDTLWLTCEALRVLAPGGVVILTAFNSDALVSTGAHCRANPAYVQSFSETTLKVLLDTVGFNPIELRRADPDPRFDAFAKGNVFTADLAQHLFGPRQLIALGHKPTAEG